MVPSEDVQFTHGVDVGSVAEYFLRADQERVEPDVTPLKLHNLLYLAQANYLASTGMRLLDSDVEAFDNGPVIDVVRQRFSGRQIIVLNQEIGAPEGDLPADIEDFLERVWERYQDYSASQLWKLTHSQDPWRGAYVEGHFHTQISDETMRRNFAEQVSSTDRIFHRSVVVVTPDVFEDDPEADGLLRDFLTSA